MSDNNNEAVLIEQPHCFKTETIIQEILETFQEVRIIPIERIMELSNQMLINEQVW